MTIDCTYLTSRDLPMHDISHRIYGGPAYMAADLTVLSRPFTRTSRFSPILDLTNRVAPNRATVYGEVNTRFQ